MLGLPPETDLMSIQRAYLEAMDTGKSHLSGVSWTLSNLNSSS